MSNCESSDIIFNTPIKNIHNNNINNSNNNNNNNNSTTKKRYTESLIPTSSCDIIVYPLSNKKKTSYEGGMDYKNTTSDSEIESFDVIINKKRPPATDHQMNINQATNNHTCQILLNNVSSKSDDFSPPQYDQLNLSHTTSNLSGNQGNNASKRKARRPSSSHTTTSHTTPRQSRSGYNNSISSPQSITNTASDNIKRLLVLSQQGRLTNTNNKRNVFSPIEVPPAFLLNSSQQQQQFATFIVQHLNQQQNQLSDITGEIDQIKNLVWTGGQILNQQSKKINTLEKDHKEAIGKLNHNLQQQEASLRAEIIFQQQQQYLQKIEFYKFQRQTRVDNIFDLIMLAIALLVSGSTPVRFFNDTISSVTISTIHLFIRHILLKHPYTFESLRVKRPTDIKQSKPGIGLDSLSSNSKVSPIAQAFETTTDPATHTTTTTFTTTQPASYGASSPADVLTSYFPHMADSLQNVLHRNDASSLSTSQFQQPQTLSASPWGKTPYYYTEQGKIRRFRKFWIFSILRFIETIYLFLFMRKVLIKLGLIQSPLQEYLRAILPPQVYKAMINAKMSNLHPYHYLPSWLPFFGAQSEKYRKTHSSISNHTESVSQYYEKDSSSRKHPRAMNLDDLQDVIRENPMTKEEIYRKILDHMEKTPESYSSTSSSGTPTYLYQSQQEKNSNNNNINNSTGNNNTQTMNQKNSNSDNTTKQSNSHDFLKSYLPSWISHPVANVVDACIDSINPFNNSDDNNENNSKLKSTPQNPLEVPLFDQDALDLLYNSASAPYGHELDISQNTDDNNKPITNQQQQQKIINSTESKTEQPQQSALFAFKDIIVGGVHHVFGDVLKD